jgi:glyoxylase-like metal-dependent hydrolase (beta-lactamase superfamily II)
VADVTIAPGGSASVFVLHEGYVGRDGDDGRVAGTVTLILDGDAVIVVDPGMVASREDLLVALAAHGPQAGDVTDVVFSHHHPDHTVNAALFPAARIHDHWAVYVGDRWIDRDADGAELGPSVRLLRTPGHTAEDISTVASTPDDVFACTHTWWGANGPADDPLGSDASALHVSREKLLSFATVIVPGHGAAFRPDQSTPR